MGNLCHTLEGSRCLQLKLDFKGEGGVSNPPRTRGAWGIFLPSHRNQTQRGFGFKGINENKQIRYAPKEKGGDSRSTPLLVGREESQQ